MRQAALLAACLCAAAPVAADAPILSLPIDCTLGKTCYIQNYVDRDSGPHALDFRCGGLSYDGHKGTDFGLPTLTDMRRGVDVLASAPGVVSGFRDGVDDVGPTDATQGRECGNGVVLRHADGWETQYCHMKSGTLTVKSGQAVLRGDVLGQVGLSGQTEFPHVHLSVRHNGETVDPFDPDLVSPCDAAGATLWRDMPEYLPGGLLDAGFSPGIPDYELVKDGSADQTQLVGDAPGLVIYGFGYASRPGDVMEMKIHGPMGEFLLQRIELDKNQAQFFRATGKRLTKARWPAGHYTGTVILRRGAHILGERHLEMDIR